MQRLFLAVFALIAACASAKAQSSFSPCDGGAKLFFINGVNKPNEQEVAASADLLATRVADFGVSCVSDVKYLYNPSDGLFMDVLSEVAKQKAAELSIPFFDAAFGVSLVWSGLPAPLFTEQLHTDIRAKLSGLIQGITLSTSFTVNGTAYTTAGLVNQFRDTLLAELLLGKPVVVVGHSQGNFFANEVQLAVAASTSSAVSGQLAVVNVATPTLVTPNNLYVTSHDDLVITPLSKIALALPSNFPVGSSSDFLGHGFAETYMNRFLPAGAGPQLSVAAQVMRLVQSALDGLGVGKTDRLDMIEIISITPSSASANVSTTFTVNFSYRLESRPAGIIYLGFNTGPQSYTLVGDGLQVFKGSGTGSLTRAITPANYTATADFGAAVNLSEFPHPTPWTPLKSTRQAIPLTP